MKKTIVWDIDDVLVPTMEHFLKYYGIIYYDTVKYDDFTENPPHKILNLTRNKYYTMIDKFRVNRFEILRPNQLILDWFEKYGHNYNNIALTSSPEHLAWITSSWVMRYFERWINTISFMSNRVNKTKLDFIKMYKKIDYFVDDNYNNIKIVKEYDKDIKCLLYRQPWNIKHKPQTCEEILKEIE